MNFIVNIGRRNKMIKKFDKIFITIMFIIMVLSSIMVLWGIIYVFFKTNKLFCVIFVLIFFSILGYLFYKFIKSYIKLMKYKIIEGKIKFELGKYYTHTTGFMLNPICFANTTLYGDNVLIAESTDNSDLMVVGQDEASAENFQESTKEEWMKHFSK